MANLDVRFIHSLLEFRLYRADGHYWPISAVKWSQDDRDGLETFLNETKAPVGTPPQDTEKVIAKLLFKRYYNDDPDQSGVCANCGHHCPSENDMQHHPGCPAIDFAGSARK